MFILFLFLGIPCEGVFRENLEVLGVNSLCDVSVFYDLNDYIEKYLMIRTS